MDSWDRIKSSDFYVVFFFKFILVILLNLNTYDLVLRQVI